MNRASSSLIYVTVAAVLIPTESSRVRVHARVIAAALGVALAYAPMLYVFFQQQWSRPQSQFFPFVIAAVAAMFWMRWQEAPAAAAAAGRRPAIIAAALAALAWTVLLLAVAMYNPWLSAFSFNLLMAAAAVMVGRRRAVVYLWGLWAMLWLMLPLPLGMDQRLISRLQLASSQLSSVLLDMTGVDHLMSGNMLLLPDRKLFVDEACSGIVSVMSVVACGVIYGVWRNRPPAHIAALAACGVFWAMIMNVVRISAIAVAWHYYRVDWTEGTPHEILSLAVFLVTFGAMLSTDQLLAGLLAPVELAWRATAGDGPYFGRRLAVLWDAAVEWGAPQRVAEDLYEHERAPRARAAAAARPMVAPAADRAAGATPRRGEARMLATLAASFSVLGAAQLSFMGWSYAHPAAPAANVADARRLDGESLPSALAGFRRTAFKAEQRERDDIFGEFSRTYSFTDENARSYMASCDFPFSQGWHELTVCYRGSGWEVTRRETRKLPGGRQDETWPITEADLEQSDGARGFVAWAMFDEHGAPVSPPSGAVLDQLWRLAMRRSPYVPTRQMFQVQVFFASVEPIAEDQRAAARQLLAAAREELRRKIVGDGRKAQQ
ncbi:MAG: hypothetical protein DCC67_12030 [Planctomycetota bacterium]|nr:MAG: hypothetical protein DCC67_12030 [Planctomycetota bacterium]